MRTLIMTISVVILSAGCASSSPETSATMAARNDVVCETVRPTGSRLPKRVCRTVADNELEQQKIDMLERRLNDRAPTGMRRAGGSTGPN